MIVAVKLGFAEPYVFDLFSAVTVNGALFTVIEAEVDEALYVVFDSWLTVIVAEPAPTIVAVLPVI